MSDDGDSMGESGGQEGVSSRRRRLLAALGAATVPAVAGCSRANYAGTANGTANETGTGQLTPTESSDGSVDARFGYVGTADASPPVEADHTVDLNIGPRDGAEIPEFYFEPTGLSVESGDTVRFNMATPHHNVNAYHPAFGYTQRVPEDAPAYSSPILGAGEYWLYTFETEGVHNIMCAPHELFGMVGSVVVGSANGPGANAVGEAPAPSEESRPPEYTAGTVLSDPAMAPDTIVDQGSVSWDDIADENKELLLAPVEE